MGVKNDNFTLSEKDSNQNSVICFLRQNPDAPKDRKIFVDICRYSIYYFSITTGLVSFSKLSIKNRTPLEEGLIEKTRYCSLHQNLDSKNSTNLISKIIRPNYRNDLYP